MSFKTIISDEVKAITHSSLKMWHERLGHLNTRAIKELVSKNLGIGVTLDYQENFFYLGCAYGKQQKSNVSKSPTLKDETWRIDVRCRSNANTIGE